MFNQSFTHRATVSRMAWVDDDGSPFQTWATVAVSLPCLYSPSTRSVEAPSDMRVADWTEGILCVSPTADVQQGDRITLTRPNGLSLIVLSDAATVMGFDSASHIEFSVRQL